MISVIGLISAIGLFLYGLLAHKAKVVALPCCCMAVTSIVWMIVFNPSNKVDSLKPSTKKKIHRISFFCMIASLVGLLASIRYSDMIDTDLATHIFITITILSGIISGFFRRYRNQWRE